jgi:DNA polymerase III subunit delta
LSDPAPVIYLLDGDDEFAIAEFLAGLQTEIGDPSTALMNITRLDGRSFSQDDFNSATSAMPFLAKYRLVILENPMARFSSKAGDEAKESNEAKKAKEAQRKFTASLEKISPSTHLILVEYRLLTSERDRKSNRLHWLEAWAFAAGERVRIKHFQLPSMEKMPGWIVSRAKAHGGQFSGEAAYVLANLLGDEPRLVDQEIVKLLTYVNYKRPVDRDDVQHLTIDMREGDIFGLVDAIGTNDTRRAMEMLLRLLEEDEPANIFAMIVRQYRLLLQAREILDREGSSQEIARQIVERDGRKIHPYVAEKIGGQARRFSLPRLETIYHRLVESDEAMKTSQAPAELVLQTLVVSLGSV